MDRSTFVNSAAQELLGVFEGEVSSLEKMISEVVSSEESLKTAPLSSDDLMRDMKDVYDVVKEMPGYIERVHLIKKDMTHIAKKISSLSKKLT